MNAGPAIHLSVLVPCLNEEANLPELVDRLGATFDRGELVGQIVLVDDGSIDDTWRVMEDLAATRPWVLPVRHDRNRGLSEAWWTAVGRAAGSLVCLIDADIQYQPEDILRLLCTYRETRCDVVQGWRRWVGHERGLRYHWSRGLNMILNGVFGMRLRDNKSGFVLMSKEVLEDLLDMRHGYRYWQCFISVAAHAKGYSIAEVETVFKDRGAGRSFLSGLPIMVIIGVLRDLGRAVVEYRHHGRTAGTSRTRS